MNVDIEMTAYGSGRRFDLRHALFGLCLVLVLLTTLPSEGVVTCHCFQQREFEPARPASADPYILATARNGLLAAASGTSKGDVVRERMKGTTESDLWFSLFIANRIGTPTGTLRRARANSHSWAAALKSLSLSTEKLGPAFETARRADEDDGMSLALADLALADGFKVPTEALAKLRAAGAGNAETVLGLLLADRTKRQPEAILEDVITRRQTWGSLLHAAGIAPGSVSDLIAEIFESRN